MFAVLVLSYGICVGKYLHPIEEKHDNPTHGFLISCFFYFAVSAAAPFTGGHLNPSVTVAFIKLRKGLDVKTYMISQIIGGLIGTTLGTFVDMKHICFSMWFLSFILRDNLLEHWWWMEYLKYLEHLCLYFLFFL